MIACQQGVEDIVRLLLASGADPNLAATKGSSDCTI